MRVGITALVLLVTVVGMAGEASAEPIEFRHEAWASMTGTLNGVGFSTIHIRVTATGDTTNRQDSLVGHWIEHDAAQVFIDGLGTFSFITQTRTFMNNNGGLPGFSRGSAIGGTDLLNGPGGVPVWDMLSSHGPYLGDGRLFQWNISPPINTSGGILEFVAADVQVEFEAHVGPGVPEPTSLALFALGALGIAIRQRRRH